MKVEEMKSLPGFWKTEALMRDLVNEKSAPWKSLEVVEKEDHFELVADGRITVYKFDERFINLFDKEVEIMPAHTFNN